MDDKKLDDDEIALNQPVVSQEETVAKPGEKIIQPPRPRLNKEGEQVIIVEPGHVVKINGVIALRFEIPCTFRINTDKNYMVVGALTPKLIMSSLKDD